MRADLSTDFSGLGVEFVAGVLFVLLVLSARLKEEL